MKRLNIIGCGSVGSTLGRLWHDASILRIGDILNRSPASAEHAVGFIGEGRAIASIEEMGPADLYLVGTPDDAIASTDRALAASGVLGPGPVVFHCSGALAASVLARSAAAGARVASVHPIKSFASPQGAVQSFPGTFCGIEGDPGAVETLQPLFSAIGGEPLPIDSSAKTIYHGASVIVCNYLAALMEVGLRAFEEAGIERETARRVMEPMVRGTVGNIFREGTASALTGPIARGDVQTVSRQLAGISEWDPDVGELYRNLGRVAVELAARKGVAPRDALETIRCALGRSESLEIESIEPQNP